MMTRTPGPSWCSSSAVQDFPVLEASGGEEGLRLAKAHKPEVIICDLLNAAVQWFPMYAEPSAAMNPCAAPGSSGYPRRSCETDRQAAFSAGADEYLTKPVDPKHSWTSTTA